MRRPGRNALNSKDQVTGRLQNTPFASIDSRQLFDNLNLLTIEQVADILGKKPQTIRNMVPRREIPFIPGRPVKFRPVAIAAWLEQKEIRPWQ